MKKGLRPPVPRQWRHKRRSMSRPDEEGITTKDCRQDAVTPEGSMSRPDEEGITTQLLYDRPGR